MKTKLFLGIVLMMATTMTLNGQSVQVTVDLIPIEVNSIQRNMTTDQYQSSVFNIAIGKLMAGSAEVICRTYYTYNIASIAN